MEGVRAPAAASSPSAPIVVEPPLACDAGWGAPVTVDVCSDIKLIRTGRYSTIHVASCPSVPAGRVAVKVYDRPALSARKRNMATREAVVLRHLNACGVPHIPHLWSAYPSASQFHLVVDYCAGGDALAALAARRGRGLPDEAVAAQFAAPLLEALSAMHAAGVVHRDVKLENVLLDASGAPLLGDFDLAVFAHNPPARAPVGTVPYMAPELFLLSAYKGTPEEGAVLARLGPGLDVWSLGVCLFELVAGYKPFQGADAEAIAAAVLHGARAPLPAGAGGAFADFVAAALTHDAAERPSAAALLAHPWVAAAAAGARAGGPKAAARPPGAAMRGARSDSAGSFEEMRRGAAAAAGGGAAAGGKPAAGEPLEAPVQQRPPPPRVSCFAGAAAAAAAAAAASGARADGAGPCGQPSAGGGGGGGGAPAMAALLPGAQLALQLQRTSSCLSTASAGALISPSSGDLASWGALLGALPPLPPPPVPPPPAPAAAKRAPLWHRLFACAGLHSAAPC
ncbi:serine threonine kinase [Raphidocelis subcapitata]|uniref:Serine threonine kinase n=1 Tax=Raphidocelis subcapitata TaxID=307507 RepID=A0A2V0PCZ5_9CHLO|nr:serine threonine kinase [Raphidocelis subcapitata]|eukprot:GBF97716.1 serine threonine kinase [Raphidocelis subcapitata]